jgi:CheY-like chemotaxis protein
MTKRVLIADDSVTIQKFVSLALAEEDMSIEYAASGDQALEKVKTLRPDLVLVDVGMPGKNGYEICSSIKGDPESAQTRVVLMVGTFEAFDEAAACEAGCDAHLTKPFDISELIQIAHSMMPGYDESPEVRMPGSGHNLRLASPAIESIELPAGSKLVSTRTRDSFLGSGRILDLFEEKKARRGPIKEPAPAERIEGAPLDFGERSGQELCSEVPAEEDIVVAHPSPQAVREISEEVINSIVERVVRRMSQEVIREIAWEVVPELADVIIRQSLEEREKQA